MKKILFISISALFVSLSCSKQIEIDKSNLLIGVWKYQGWTESGAIFSRSSEFADNHCYRFNGDGTLTERKNSGWCGTPPITYADYAGAWRILNDSLIYVNVGYWGGTTSYRIDIESVDESVLRVQFIYDRK
jgi:hypothetical protein